MKIWPSCTKSLPTPALNLTDAEIQKTAAPTFFFRRRVRVIRFRLVKCSLTAWFTEAERCCISEGKFVGNFMQRFH